MKAIKYNIRLLIAGLVMVVALSTILMQHTNAAACANGTYGTVTKSFSVSQTGNFRVWVRLQAASTTNNSVKIELNGNTCFTAGDSTSIPVGSWTWVNYQNGSTTNKMAYNFTALNNSLKIIGSEQDVKVDKVIFIPSPEGDACVPSNTRSGSSEPGDNCATVGTVDAPVINSFSANPSSVVAGSKTTFSWNTANTVSCSINPGGTQDNTGFTWLSSVLTTIGTKTYTLDCKNSANAHVTKQTNLTVTQAVNPPQKPIFTASKTQVQKGSSVTFAWDSVGATSCLFNPGNFSSSAKNSGYTVSNITTTTTYSLKCSNAAGSTNADSITVTATDTPPPVALPVIVQLKADPINVPSGGISVISWLTTGVPSGGCRISPNGPISSEPNTSWTTPVLTSSTSYTLTCVNSEQKSTSKSVSVTVDGKPAPVNPAPVLPSQSSADAAEQAQIIDSTTGDPVANTAVNDTVCDLATLDPGSVSSVEQQQNILKAEFYNGEDLVQTVTEPPFALNTKLLSNGTYTITQRSYFKDGSESEVTKVLSVSCVLAATQGSTKSGTGKIAVGTGVLAVAVLAGVIVFRKKWIPYAEPFVESVLARFGKSSYLDTTIDVDTKNIEKPEQSGYAEPTIIKPDKK